MQRKSLRSEYFGCQGRLPAFLSYMHAACYAQTLMADVVMSDLVPPPYIPGPECIDYAFVQNM